MLTETTDDMLSFSQIIQVLRRGIGTMITMVVIGVLLAVLAAQFMPKKYKSKAILTIQSAYFQHPLVSNVVSEIQDPTEMSSQRLSLLRLALNDQFLDKLGEKYNIYEYPTDSPLRSLDREMFLKRIEYFSISPGSFQIAITTNNAKTAQAAAREVLDQMTLTLIEHRYQQLVQAQQAILKQAKLLNTTLGSGLPTSQREALETQLATMQANLARLQSHFTESHPDVVRTKGAARALKARLTSMEVKPDPKGEEYNNVFMSSSSRATTQEIFNDLLKKLSHLNVVLEMERDRANVSYLGVIEKPSLPLQPFFPNPITFGVVGAITGLVLALMMMTASELRRKRQFSPLQVESYFGLELLGELPPLTPKEKQLFLPDSGRKSLMALPLIVARES